MNNLQRLKKRLFKQEASEQDQVNSLCAVMEICGGYEPLMNMPLPAMYAVLKYLEWKAKQEQKAYSKIKSHR